jgi:hypothetical protein
MSLFGEITGEAMSLFGGMSVQQVVGTEHARRGFLRWSSGQIEVPHSKVGGITSHHATLEGFHQSNDHFSVAMLPCVVGRDASTVLSVMEGSQRYQPRRAHALFSHSCA